MLVAITAHQRVVYQVEWERKVELHFDWAMVSNILKPLAVLCATFLDDFAMGPKTAIHDRLYLIPSVHL